MGALSFVEKTTLPRNYVPDYVVFFHGLPVCVVEAKVPDVPVRKAIEEARLYADTLNKQFPSKVNPIEVVVGCNGRELAVGPVDTNAADIFSVNDLVVGSAKLQELKKKLGVERLNAIGELHKIEPQRLPRSNRRRSSTRRFLRPRETERARPVSYAPLRDVLQGGGPGENSAHT